MKEKGPSIHVINIFSGQLSFFSSSIINFEPLSLYDYKIIDEIL